MWFNQVVSSNVYVARLHDYGIDLSAGNILVYQGTIENVFTVTPEQRTKMFEAASGSLQYKNEYEQQRKSIEAIKEEIMRLQSKKRSSLKEKQKLERASKHCSEVNQQKEELVSYTAFWINSQT